MLEYELILEFCGTAAVENQISVHHQTESMEGTHQTNFSNQMNERAAEVASSLFISSVKSKGYSMLDHTMVGDDLFRKYQPRPVSRSSHGTWCHTLSLS